MFHSSHYAAPATRSEFGDVSLNCDADFYPCLAKAPAPHHTRWVSRTSPQVTNLNYRATATRRSDAAMAAAAAPGSGARVMGRPITSRSAPASSASSGVATRAWSCASLPVGRTPA